MDFLDPHKKRVQKIELIIGYVLVGILLILVTVILLYYAYGFSLGKNGQIIQNGLVFVSSTPSAANISVSGAQKGTTNARLILPSGQYLLNLQKTGYRTWSRAFNVEGGSVEHFDYPFLIPSKLVSKNNAIYASEPQLVLESPSRQWLLVEETGTTGVFDQYNLNNPQTAPTTIVVPSNVLTPVTSGTQSLSLVEWSNDNQHIILAHTMPSGTEYILFNRQTPADSVNLNTALKISPTNIEFWNDIYTQFYIYDPMTQDLSTVTLSDPTPKTVLTGVLAYKTYGNSIVAYASDEDVPTGETAIRIQDGSNTYTVRYVPSNSQYVINLAQYSGNWYLAAGATNENKVYIYENPEQQLQNQPNQPLVPVDILKLLQPNYVNFSADTRMILAENGTHFAVYDVLNDKDYSYSVSTPLDAPQTHATWMDGEQLVLVSGGKSIIFDFDDANQQTLSPAEANVGLFFDQSYKYIYDIAPNTSTDSSAADPFALSNTALRIPTDL